MILAQLTAAKYWTLLFYLAQLFDNLWGRRFVICTQIWCDSLCAPEQNVYSLHTSIALVNQISLIAYVIVTIAFIDIALSTSLLCYE